ncbi:MAG: hypoxanthine phosphoribosyltransferase [Rikenellaceae bacterium]|jgi:hypoxanthine phosphoribosyltransferase|nr:hypoxanthine phosphoribosyltransferase [Rikenellaceae bacterium]
MKRVTLHDKTFECTIPEAEILRRIDLLAEKLNRQWRGDGQVPLFVSVLSGAFLFTAELLKRLDFTCEVAFVKLSSYRGTQSAGEVAQVIGLEGHTVAGREVIVLEDIVETGNTVEAVLRLLEPLRPDSVAFAVLFFKPEVYHKSIAIDHYAMELPAGFIVGFGLDYNQLGRNLRDIYTLVEGNS